MVVRAPSARFTLKSFLLLALLAAVYLTCISCASEADTLPQDDLTFLDEDGYLLPGEDNRYALALWTRTRYSERLRMCIYGGLAHRGASLEEVDAYCADYAK